jgi:cyanate permease
MLGGVWLIYASFGVVLGAIPPLVVYLSEDLALSRAAMGSVLGAWQLFYIVFAVPAGALIDRFGLRISLTLGVGLMALSGLLRSLAVSHVTLFLAVGVFGLGGPFISIGAPKLISAWFGDRDRGTAMGIYLTAPSIGRIAALATANSLLMPLYGESWRLTVATYAAAAVLAGLVWWIVAREPADAEAGDRDEENTPPGQGTDGTAPEEGGSAGGRSDAGRRQPLAGLAAFPALLRLRAVRLVLLFSFGSFLFNHGFSNWLPEILRVGGMTAAKAGLWAAIPTGIGLIATVVIPKLATARRRIPILLASFAAAAIAALLVAGSARGAVVSGLLLAGVAGRGVTPVLMLSLIESPKVGSERMGAAGGLYFTAGEVGGVLGPLLLGVISDATGGFAAGLAMLAAVNVALALASLRLGAVARQRD